MRWLDVAGPPGCGKSTLCYPVWGDKSVGWDGKLPQAYWKPYLDETTVLMRLVMDHPSIEAVIRMNDRSAKKMSTVERMDPSIVAAGQTPDITRGKVESNSTFIHTGLVQRILGFGWRLKHMNRDVNLIRRALWLMPVSVGVAFLEASDVTIEARNKARESVKETAHENRAFQVPLMREAIGIAKDVLRERGIPIIEIDVEQSIEAARAELLAFAAGASVAPQVGPSGEMALLQSPPQWWR
jgi:hypothetical protein